jgi:transcriptional regulator with XRE-family HTH domain
MNEARFGGTLRRSRLEAGFSLRQLAERVHFSPGQLSKVENGRRRPSPALARLCDDVLRTGGTLSRLVREYLADVEAATTDNWSIDEPLEPALCDLVLDRYRLVLDQLRAFEQQAPAHLVLRELVPAAETLERLSRANPVRTRDFLLLTLDYADVIERLARQNGRDDAAGRWIGRSELIGAQLADPDLVAQGLVRRAGLALYRQDAHEVLLLAEQARTMPGITGRMRALATLRAAQGHALTGNLTACRELLAVALGLFGERQDAATVLRTAIDRIPPGARKIRRRYGMRLANALAEVGDLTGRARDAAVPPVPAPAPVRPRIPAQARRDSAPRPGRRPAAAGSTSSRT